MKTAIASPLEYQFYLSGQLHPTPALNTMTYAVRVQGPLLADRLTDCLRQFCLRHASMRASWQMTDGNLLRTVSNEAPAALLDLGEVPASDVAVVEASEALRQSVSPETTAWKAQLLKHGPDEHTFLFSAHRAMWDESSTEILAAELSALYSADGKPDDVRVPVPAAAEEPAADPTLDEGQAAALAASYAKTMAEFPGLHAFPLRGPRPMSLALEAETVAQPLPESLRRRLQKTATTLGVEPFVVLAAAGAYVLAQYSCQKKLTLGLPFDLRAPGHSGAVGSHTAVLPVGIDSTGGTFEELVRRTALQCNQARPLARIPFHSLVKACGASIHPGANPLFQIACVADKPLQLSLANCVCVPLAVPAPPQQLDLFLQLAPGSLQLSFSRDLIDRGVASAFVNSLSVFLQAALQKPGRELASLPILGEADSRTLSAVNSRSEEAAFLDQDLYALVTRHCQAGNDKVAVICGGQTLSYAELLPVVERIAGRLSAAGVASRRLVGICMPRSIDMLASMLAVLRSGAAYVPLDPSFPAERLRYMAEHSKLDVIVTTRGLRTLFEGHAAQLIELEQPAADAPAPAVTDVPGTAPAYVIYTSGSTGKPKGVAIPRQAVANFLLSMLRRPGLSAEDVLCAVTTLSFDIAVLELLAPLCAGATVVIASEEEGRDPRLLMDLLRASSATILQATPVTWQMLCAAGYQGGNSIKALCGGEALTPALAQALRSRVRELWNMYGPTETTVWSTCQRIDDPNGPISVGAPIHNTYLYVVDDDLRQVPCGVEGRLLIGGAGVALGYLFDDELTAARFLPDAYRGTGRMYDTGDRARLDASGQLFILGRSDFQVKIRGYRIELGEIEARLCAQSSIEAAVCQVLRQDEQNPELVAYYTLKASTPAPSVADLRSHCAATLPPYMIPSRFRCLEALPRTPNGKVDRKALPKPAEESARVPAASSFVPRGDVERTVHDVWRAVLGIEHAGANDSFFELGGTSVAALSVAQELGRRLGTPIAIVKIFEHPTIAALARFIEGNQASAGFVHEVCAHVKRRRETASSPTAFDVAIIGCAGRFPGAQNLDELWENLAAGKESVTTFTRAELDPLVPERERNDPHYIPARGILDGIDRFDAAFFAITPNEAELMDPQLRVFMETAWEAFEHAGYVGEAVAGPVGVWAGMGNNFYYHYNVLTRPDKLAIMGEIAAEIANEKDHIAPRVSHKLNLGGPSLSVHTACSTTLVVVENAYQALVSHQVDMALAGGVDIRTPQKSGQRHEEGGVFSIDGHCRPFDAAATGTMFGEGVGAVVLKRYDDAVRDNDTIYAVIKGAAANHDGGRKVSYLAPSVEGQARVVASALALGDIHPDTLTYIEAHGTATPIGDPIEVEALTQVFRAFTQRRRYCAIGSIKGNFGHATTAAGIAGVLKVVLALHHRQIPATLHFKTPNPRIDFASSPFFVNNKLMEWRSDGTPRRAGVSSFGFCGTNAHVVLEEAPPPPDSSDATRPAQLLLLSARSPVALDALAEKWSVALEGMSPTELADAAYTAQVGRKRFEYRRCAVGTDVDDLRKNLTQKAGARSASVHSDSDNPGVAFVFPGQGAQYINMGARLYQGEPCYREAIDRCATGLLPHLGCDLRDFLFPNPDDAERAQQSLNNTFYTQPAIFSTSYALALQMQHLGIRPSAFLGHSIGEFVAATLSGVMVLEDALRLVATRGRLMQDLPGGSMLTVRLSRDKVSERLPAGVDVAAANGPELTVVAGPTDVVKAFAEQLTADQIVNRLLHTSHAFHSSMMDPVVEPFLRVVEKVTLREPQVPMVSTVTGNWVKPGELTVPMYWARHLRSPVLFSHAVQLLLADEARTLLECGPRRTCSSLAMQHRPKRPDRIVATMPDSAEPEDEYPSFLLALGCLWLNGANPDWTAFHEGEVRRRIALPSYPFQRKRYWIEPGTLPTNLGRAQIQVAVARRADDVAAADAEGDTATDPVLRTIRTFVEDLLGSAVESFDAQARFIALGLDSLLLTQLARRVRVQYGVEITFRDLVQKYTSPALLAEALRTSPAAQPAAPAEAKPAQPQPAQVTKGEQASISSVLLGQLVNLSSKEHPRQVICRARVGRDETGRLGWYIPDADRPGRFVKVEHHG